MAGESMQRVIALVGLEPGDPILWGWALPLAVAVCGWVVMYAVQRRWTPEIRARLAAWLLAVVPMGIIGGGAALYILVDAGDMGAALQMGGLGLALCAIGYWIGKNAWLRFEHDDGARPNRKLSRRDRIIMLVTSLVLIAYYAWMALR